MSRFTMDNTEGYAPKQLEELNSRYDERLERFAAVRDIDKSMADRIAELVLAAYDDELASAPATEDEWAAEARP